MIEDRLPVRFGTTVEHLREEGERVHVALSDGEAGSFDLVVGADGAHSRIRSLVFGEEERFRRFLGYVTAAFLTDPPREAPVPENAFSFLTVPGRQVGVYPIPGERLVAFFVHRAGGLPGDLAGEAAVRELRSVYEGTAWIVPALLARCRPSALFVDEVFQIAMPSWSLGRVVLVGDACQCLSLLTAQGASMAMAGAYVLAEDLREPETTYARPFSVTRGGSSRQSRECRRRDGGWAAGSFRRAAHGLRSGTSPCARRRGRPPCGRSDASWPLSASFEPRTEGIPMDTVTEVNAGRVSISAAGDREQGKPPAIRIWNLRASVQPAIPYFSLRERIEDVQAARTTTG